MPQVFADHLRKTTEFAKNNHGVSVTKIEVRSIQTATPAGPPRYLVTLVPKEPRLKETADNTITYNLRHPDSFTPQRGYGTRTKFTPVTDENALKAAGGLTALFEARVGNEELQKALESLALHLSKTGVEVLLNGKKVEPHATQTETRNAAQTQGGQPNKTQKKTTRLSWPWKK